MFNLSPKPTVAEVQMSFPNAMAAVIKGSLITRKAWNDINEYGLLADGWLTIHTKGAFHRWTVNDGDLLAVDWIILAKNN